MILVDSSVWIQHFKENSKALRHALENEDILMHPMILGELSLGTYKNRKEILELLSALPMATIASEDEVFVCIEKFRLYGKGLGWIDVNLIASSMLTRCQLWTYDRALLTEGKKTGLPTLNF